MTHSVHPGMIASQHKPVLGKYKKKKNDFTSFCQPTSFCQSWQSCANLHEIWTVYYVMENPHMIRLYLIVSVLPVIICSLRTYIASHDQAHPVGIKSNTRGT